MRIRGARSCASEAHHGAPLKWEAFWGALGRSSAGSEQAGRFAGGMNLISLTKLTYVSFCLRRDWTRVAPGIARSRARPRWLLRKRGEPTGGRAAEAAPKLM